VFKKIKRNDNFEKKYKPAVAVISINLIKIWNVVSWSSFEHRNERKKGSTNVAVIMKQKHRCVHDVLNAPSVLMGQKERYKLIHVLLCKQKRVCRKILFILL